jgi:signal peptidase I
MANKTDDETGRAYHASDHGTDPGLDHGPGHGAHHRKHRGRGSGGTADIGGEERSRSGWREFFSTVAILAGALLVALLIITFVFRSYQVDGPSMEATLQNDDKLIIWKVPRTWARVTGHDYIPDRGDIIVFTQSGLGQFNQQDTKQLIKRVIGLPGDRVVVHDGRYTIYNKAHPHGFDPDASLPYGKDIPPTQGNIDVRLGKHQLFVSGDNRPDSLDSRSFGPINADQIIGKLIVRVFPLGSTKIF